MNEESFADRLKRFREAAGLSQAQLAEKAGLHRFGVAKIEQGLREPGWGTVQAICGALGLSCSAFEVSLIRKVRVIRNDDGKEARPVQGYARLISDRKREGGFRETATVLTDKELLRELEETAKKELASWVSRHAVLTELTERVAKAAGLRKASGVASGASGGDEGPPVPRKVSRAAGRGKVGPRRGKKKG